MIFSIDENKGPIHCLLALTRSFFSYFLPASRLILTCFSNPLLSSVQTSSQSITRYAHSSSFCSSAMAPPHKSMAASGDCSNFLSRPLARRMKVDRSWIACRSIAASLNKLRVRGHWSTIPSALDLEGPLGVGSIVVVAGVAGTGTPAWLLSGLG